MKYLVAAIIILLGSPFGCSAETNPDVASSPTGLLVDSLGGIYWARAPTGYYAGKSLISIKRYMKKVGLDDAEVPLFEMDAEFIKKVHAVIPSSSRKGGTGEMVFLFIFFYADGSSVKRSAFKEDLKKAIDILPARATRRLASMYEIADKANKPN